MCVCETAALLAHCTVFPQPVRGNLLVHPGFKVACSHFTSATKLLCHWSSQLLAETDLTDLIRNLNIISFVPHVVVCERESSMITTEMDE